MYYVQYAHARICSILRKLESEGVTYQGAEGWAGYAFPEASEQELMRLLAAFPAEIVLSAQRYDPARINHYVTDLAGAFHKFYNSCRMVTLSRAGPAGPHCSVPGRKSTSFIRC